MKSSILAQNCSDIKYENFMNISLTKIRIPNDLSSRIRIEMNRHVGSGSVRTRQEGCGSGSEINSLGSEALLIGIVLTLPLDSEGQKATATHTGGLDIWGKTCCWCCRCWSTRGRWATARGCGRGRGSRGTPPATRTAGPASRPRPLIHSEPRNQSLHHPPAHAYQLFHHILRPGWKHPIFIKN